MPFKEIKKFCCDSLRKYIDKIIWYMPSGQFFSILDYGRPGIEIIIKYCPWCGKELKECLI